MTLTLILTRHAKSDWGTPGQPDFDRPLNGRGRRSARALGEWLALRGLRPAEVVPSGARRTVETWEGMARAFDPAPPVRTDMRLYDAPAERMLEVLREAEASPVLLIGHNPGIGAFAGRLAAAPPAHPRFGDYPTGATTVFRFARDTWREVGWGEGEVADFVTARELTD
jgi:phosphohistidine phosphatase